MALGAIIFSQIGMVLNCRTEKQSVFKVGIFKNRLVNIGIGVEILLFCFLSYMPFCHGLFNTAPIHWQEWIYLVLCPIPVLLFEEIRKVFLRKKEKARVEKEAAGK